MGKVGLARVQRLKSDSGSGKVVDARDEGELGVSASMRREGGREEEGKITPMFTVWKRILWKMERILWKEAWVPSPKACSLLRPFRGAVLGQLPRVQLQTHSKQRLGFREGSRSLCTEWTRGS